jgi:hypothetical protein
LLLMVKLPKVPDTPEDFNDVIACLQSGVFAPKYNTPSKRKNLRRRCQDLTYDNKSGCLFYTEKPTDENSQPVKKRIIPTYDKELREALLEKFHVGASHFEYHKTYTMLYEKHIGITQSEVKAFVRKCPTCIRNVTIKEKNDITPIIANAPFERLQMDLVDLLSFAEHNDGYSSILTMVDVFSRYVWVIPLKDKEGSTINKKLVRHFSMFGPPTELQSDNGSEFITDVLKKTCNMLKVSFLWLKFGFLC